MLSDTLKSLAGHIEGWSNLGGVHLNARACASLAAVIAATADDVAQLEALPVPAALRGGNVVSLDAARDNRRMRALGGDWGAA